jgi:hypothetical protein
MSDQDINKSHVDLSLVSIDDIFKEIDRRFDMWVYAGIQIRDRKEQSVLTVRKWQGNSATCAGLASQLQIAIYDTHVEKDEIDDHPFEM